MPDKDACWGQLDQSAYSKMKGIIETSVNFYNQALLLNRESSISDLDFKTAKELNQDYAIAYEILFEAVEIPQKKHVIHR